jgi:hypothetical protein
MQIHLKLHLLRKNDRPAQIFLTYSAELPLWATYSIFCRNLTSFWVGHICIFDVPFRLTFHVAFSLLHIIVYDWTTPMLRFVFGNLRT